MAITDLCTTLHCERVESCKVEYAEELHVKAAINPCKFDAPLDFENVGDQYLAPEYEVHGLTGQFNILEAIDFAGGFVDVDSADRGRCGSGIEFELELSLQLDTGSSETTVDCYT